MIYDQKRARQSKHAEVRMSTGKGAQKCEVKGRFCSKNKMATVTYRTNGDKVGGMELGHRRRDRSCCRAGPDSGNEEFGGATEVRENVGGQYEA